MTSILCQTDWDWSADAMIMQQLLGISTGVQINSESFMTDSEDLNSLNNHCQLDYDDGNEPITYLNEDQLPCHESGQLSVYCGLEFGPPLILQQLLESRANAVTHLERQKNDSDEFPLDETLRDYVTKTDAFTHELIHQTSAEKCCFCGQAIQESKVCCEQYKTFSRLAVRVKKVEAENTENQQSAGLSQSTVQSASSTKRTNKGNDRLSKTDNKTKGANETEARRAARERSEQRRAARAALARERLARQQAARKNMQTTTPSIMEAQGAGVYRGGGQQTTTTLSYQLSSKKCSDDGWTVWPNARVVVSNPVSGNAPSTSKQRQQLDAEAVAEGQLHQEDVGGQVLMRYYDNGKLFITMFKEGSGSVFYPDGKVAISIIPVGLGLFTYVVQDDSTEGAIVAVFLPSGHGIIHHPSGSPRICLTPTGGEEFDIDGSKRRRWDWHDIVCDTETGAGSTSGRLQTFYPIVIGVNFNCGIRIISQQKISLTFSAECRSCRFQIGAKYSQQKSRRKSSKMRKTGGRGDQMFLRHVRERFNGLLRNVITTLQFPNSPKLESLTLPGVSGPLLAETIPK